MLSKVVEHYPSWAANGVKLDTKPFEGSSKTRQIQYCQCLYSVGSAQEPDNLRSQNISMAHLTEVGLWKETKGKKPEDLVQSIFVQSMTVRIRLRFLNPPPRVWVTTSIVHG